MLPISQLQGGSLQGGAALQPAVGASYLQPTMTAQQLQPTANPQQNNVNPQSGIDYQLAAQQAAAAAEAQHQATIAAINNSFAPLLAQYDSQQSDLDRQRAANEGIVGREYNSNKGGLDLGNQQGNQNLDRSQAKVDYTRSTSLRDLGNNISSAMQSRLQQIGSLGGGSSSAGYGLSMALHGVDSQARGNLIDQAQLQYGDIGIQRKQLQDSYTQAIGQLNTWRDNQVSKIANDYLTQKGQIDRMRAGANAQQQQALAAQSTALAQQASAQLAQIQQGYTAALPQVDTSGAGAIGAAGSQLGAVNYKVNPLTGSDPSLNYSGTQNNAAQNFFPLFGARGRQDQSF